MVNTQFWLKKLKEYSFTEKDFNSDKKEMTKQFGKKAPDSDVIWGLFNKAIIKNRNNRDKLKELYYLMASFLKSENRPKEQILQIKKLGDSI